MEEQQPLTDADYEAARRALEINPSLAMGDYDAALPRVARSHQRLGTSRFELLFGVRPPANENEERDRGFFVGTVSRDEYRRRLATLPVDSEMLNTAFAEAQELTDNYGSMLQALLDPDLRACGPIDERAERRIDKLAESLAKKSALYKENLRTLSQFLTEMRVVKQLGCAAAGGFNAPTAVQLIRVAAWHVRESWKSCRELAYKSQTQPQYLYAASARHLFDHVSRGGLPRPLDLETLVEQESVAASLYLRECGGTWPPVGEIHTPEAKAERQPLLSVKQWSELAIGIDEHKYYWALTPAPAVGGVLQKGSAIQLPLRGGRWPAVMKALADSPHPGKARRFDVLRELGLLPPPGTSRRNSQHLARVQALDVAIAIAALKR